MGQFVAGGESGDQVFAGGGAATVWQAQGVLMELLGTGPQEAGQVLRQIARDHGQALIETSAAIVESRDLPV